MDYFSFPAKDETKSEKKKRKRDRETDETSSPAEPSTSTSKKEKKKRRKESDLPAVTNDEELAAPESTDGTLSKKEKKKKQKQKIADADVSAQAEVPKTPSASSSAPASQDEIAAFLTKHSVTIQSPEGKPTAVLSFDQLAIPSGLKAALSGFKEPTPIQACSWPPALEGKDVIGIAETGRQVQFILHTTRIHAYMHTKHNALTLTRHPSAAKPSHSVSPPSRTSSPPLPPHRPTTNPPRRPTNPRAPGRPSPSSSSRPRASSPSRRTTPSPRSARPSASQASPSSGASTRRGKCERLKTHGTTG